MHHFNNSNYLLETHTLKSCLVSCLEFEEIQALLVLGNHGLREVGGQAEALYPAVITQLGPVEYWNNDSMLKDVLPLFLLT